MAKLPSRLTLRKGYYAFLTGLYNLKLTRGLVGGAALLSGAALMFTALPESSGNAAQASTPKVEVSPAINESDMFADITQQYAVSGDTVTLTLKPGDSLGPLLQKNGVPPATAYALTQSFAKAYNPRNLRAGQDFTLYFDGSDISEDQPRGALANLTYKPTIERTIFINRVEGAEQDEFTARDLTVTFPSEVVKVTGTIENSLYLDAANMGVPDKVTVQFSQIYEHSVDFQRDIRKGDAFEITFELFRDHKGNPIKAGDLLFTSFSPRGKTSEYYLYQTSAGHENYYSRDGKGAKRKLMRTPINGARLSSRYGKRRHPVLGYVKTHKGVDFAAPRGTPIMAAGVGVVERANRYGSFGNYVRIRHSDGYKTAYAHLKSFARGIKSGTRVRQGQIIGYVGTTGRSTGPHLHYEVHKNGRAINPSSLSTLSGKPLPKGDKPRFDERRIEIDQLREAAGPVIINIPAPESVETVSLNTPLNSDQ